MNISILVTYWMLRIKVLVWKPFGSFNIEIINNNYEHSKVRQCNTVGWRFTAQINCDEDVPHNVFIDYLCSLSSEKAMLSSVSRCSNNMKDFTDSSCNLSSAFIDNLYAWFLCNLSCDFITNLYTVKCINS